MLAVVCLLASAVPLEYSTIHNMYFKSLSGSVGLLDCQKEESVEKEYGRVYEGKRKKYNKQ